MAGKGTLNPLQLNDSATATNNFVLKADNAGGVKLSRGNDGATTQDILTVDANGRVAMPQNLVAFAARGTTTNQAVTSNTWTKVQLQAEDFDTAGAFDATTNYRFQPTVAGYYALNGCVRVSANGGTMSGYVCEIWKNGAAHVRGSEAAYTTGIANSGAMQTTVSSVVYLNGSTDFVELYGLVVGTNTSFANATTNRAGSCWFDGSLIARA